MDEAVCRSLTGVQSSPRWHLGCRPTLATVVAGFNPHAEQALEVGCSPGGSAAMLANFGIVSTFEPHDGALASAISRDVATVLSGALPDGISFPHTFDLVCAFDVVEHVAADLAAVQALGAGLKRGGRLLLTVPAHPWLWRGQEVRNRRHTRKTLARLITDAGLRVNSLASFNARLFPLVAATRAVLNSLGLGVRAEKTIPSPRVNRFLEKILAAEAGQVAVCICGTGVSLLAVASAGQAGQA